MSQPQENLPAHGRREPAGARARLQMARQVGAVAAGVLGQFAVAMPDGYFGPSDEVTTFGLVYSAGMLALLAATIVGLARRSP